MFSGTKCLNLVNIPIFLEFFFFKLHQCSMLDVSSMILKTLKNLIELTVCNETPSRLMLSLTFQHF